MSWFADVFSSGTPDGFARSARAALVAAGCDGEIRYNAADFTLHVDDGVVDLHNVYAEFGDVGRLARPAWFRRFAVMHMAIRATGSIKTFEDARPLLLPRIRERFYHHALALRRRAGQPAPDFEIPVQDVSPHHVAELVCDYPTHVASVSTEDLERWRVPFDVAFEAALANLRHIPLEAVAKIGDGAICSMSGDSHDASRLLVPEVFRKFPVVGDMIVIAPHRDTLLVAGSDDPNALAVIAALAEDRLQEPRAMTGVALRRSGGAWVEYMPPPEHPAHAAFRALADGSHARDCGEQQELLREAFEREGAGSFVASVMWRRNDEGDGEPGGTYSVWTRGLDTLLPRTDQIAFFEPSAKEGGEGNVLGFAAWDDVLPALDERALVERQRLYPERWRVCEFPEDDVLRSLGLEA